MLLIKTDLGKVIQTFLMPSKPCLAIMEGAVLFGINPNIINSRIAKYTIGTDVRLPWDEKTYSKNRRKVFNDVENKWVCKDALKNICGNMKKYIYFDKARNRWKDSIKV